MQRKTILKFILAFALVLLGGLGFGAYVALLAPVTPEHETELKIRRGARLAQVADSLVARHIIRDRGRFVTAAKVTRTADKLKAGRYIIPPRASNLDLIQLFASGKAARHRLPIPEGWTSDAIAALLQRELEVDSAAFMTLVNNGETAHSLGVEASSLDGYLYPDTYQFFWGDSAAEVIGVLVGEFHRRVPDSLRTRAEKLGIDLHQAITLASIIEGEAMVDSERAVISAVYWNRLRKGMRLQADPTIQYLIPGPPRRVLIRDLEIDSPYNTYLHPGLPPGPVNNPGIKSILAALYPKPVDYLYFVARGDGAHVFSYTLVQHNMAKRQFDLDRAKVRASVQPPG